VVLTLDREERKMSLGLKQLKPDPWADIEVKYPVGSQHSALVKNFTNYGIFVELEEGVDGLIHISDLSWTKKIKHPSEFVKLDEKIDVKVLDIDKENRKLSLGHKQLEEDPWETFSSVFDPESNHEGTIIDINDKGAIVSLAYGIEGFAPKKHLRKEDGSMAAVEEKLPFAILEFSKEDKKILVSHTRTWEAAKEEHEKSEEKKVRKATKETMKTLNKNVEKTTLGDLDALSNLKQEMEEKEKNK
jgi:small subunit ribosomal protein S1